VEIEKCKIEMRRDSWDSVFVEATLDRGTRLPVRGTGIPADLRAAGDPNHALTSAALGIEVWSGNYGHWIAYHLPKMLAFIENGWGEQILLPERGRWKEVEARDEEFVRLLDADASSWPRLKPGISAIGKLALIDGDPHHGSLLRRAAQRLIKNASIGVGGRRRRILISREHASRRRLVNERELASKLQPYGFETISLERLALVEQIRAFANAEFVLGMHGSGLANPIFCPHDATIIEVIPRDFPCPDFYRLATSVGLRYCVVFGDSVGDGNPGNRDMVAPMEELVDMVKNLVA
jgi:capsular polysaccharide biosynthesis protein